MVVLDNQALEHISLVKLNQHHSSFSGIPTVDLSNPTSAETTMVRACKELGFFKVVNHGVPLDIIRRLEAEGEKFFSRPQLEKERCGEGKEAFQYGSKTIGLNGDVGWLEYLLMHANSGKFNSKATDSLNCCLKEYITEVRKLASEVLEMMASGMGLKQKDVLSEMVMHEESDTVFRMNYYPPCPVVKERADCTLTGFGEHTDPQIISVLRSNNTNGLQILLKEGRWVSVPPDPYSFYIFVGDSLQVLTNGRFRSVKHRVLANSKKPRISMIYLGAPPCWKRVAPLLHVMEDGEKSHYRDFTWSDYKMSAYKTKLADNRLQQFEKET